MIVFNFPYEEFRWDSIRMNVMQYYVKRCIALPGDTLEIREGIYKVRGCNEQLGNSNAMQYLAGLQRPEEQGIVTGHFLMMKIWDGISGSLVHYLFRKKGSL